MPKLLSLRIKRTLLLDASKKKIRQNLEVKLEYSKSNKVI
jgi:hypothetical protein